MSRDRSTVAQLRTVIDCLPTHTREAMLEGIRTNEIIVGAYSDRDGGVCPMLAAHRCGGRTSFISFAKAWDAFTGVKRARRATERELGVLERHLVASLVAEGTRTPVARGNVDFGAAITEHATQARARRAAEVGAPVDMAGAIAEHQTASRERRTREAAATGGWGFLKERRERGDAERALERLEREQARAERRERELV